MKNYRTFIAPCFFSFLIGCGLVGDGYDASQDEIDAIQDELYTVHDDSEVDAGETWLGLALTLNYLTGGWEINDQPVEPRLNFSINSNDRGYSIIESLPEGRADLWCSAIDSSTVDCDAWTATKQRFGNMRITPYSIHMCNLTDVRVGGESDFWSTVTNVNGESPNVDELYTDENELLDVHATRLVLGAEYELADGSTGILDLASDEIEFTLEDIVSLEFFFSELASSVGPVGDSPEEQDLLNCPVLPPVQLDIYNTGADCGSVPDIEGQGWSAARSVRVHDISIPLSADDRPVLFDQQTDTNFHIRASAAVAIEEPGTYTFAVGLGAGDTVQVDVGGQRAVQPRCNRWGTPAEPVVVVGESVVLERGRHALQVAYSDDGHKDALVLMYSGPDTADEMVVVPESAFAL